MRSTWKSISGIVGLLIIVFLIFNFTGGDPSHENNFEQNEISPQVDAVAREGVEKQEKEKMGEEILPGAIEACDGLGEGDSCVIETIKDGRQGVCGFVEEELFCSPDIKEKKVLSLN